MSLTKIINTGIKNSEITGSKINTASSFSFDVLQANTLTVANDIQSNTTNLIFDIANSSGVYANAAFDLSNTTNTLTQSTYNQVNTTNSTAQAAFDAANNAVDTWVRDAANSSSSYANGAYDVANTADQRAITSGVYANSGFSLANTANSTAQAAFDTANNAVDTWVRDAANSASSYSNSAYAEANTKTTTTYVDNAISNLTSEQLTWSYYETEEDLPSATEKHGMFAHVHGTGYGYYAHAGQWIKLANYDDIANLVNSAPATLDTLNELAAALNNDPEFATTIATNIGIIGNYANSAYVQANTPSQVANSASSYANSGYSQANSNFTSAVTQLVITTPVFNYNIDQYSGDNPEIYVAAGETIAFDLNQSSSHPFAIRVSSSGSNYDTGLTHVADDGTISTGSSAQGKTSGKLYWKIPFALTGLTYVYQCTNHSSMVGNIVIQPPVSFVASNTELAFNTANSSGVYANDAYTQANTPSQVANSASVYANSAYLQANTPSHVANSASSYANGAYGIANTATINAAQADQRAVISGNYANSAYLQANTPSQVANSSSSYANGAYGIANTANTLAQAAYDQANTGGGGGGGSGLFNSAINVAVGYAVTSTLANAVVFSANSIVHSIYLTNISDDSTSNTQVTGDFTPSGSSNVSIFYKIPLPHRSSVEIIKKPQVVKTNDILKLQSFEDDVPASSNAYAIIVYETTDSAEYERVGKLLTDSYANMYTSTSNPSVLESIKLVNQDSAYGNHAITVVWTNSSNTLQGLFTKELILPANSTIELCETPKYLDAGDKIDAFSSVAGSNKVSILVSAKKII